MTNKLQARTVVKPMGDETKADEEGKGMIRIHCKALKLSDQEMAEVFRFDD